MMGPNASRKSMNSLPPTSQSRAPLARFTYGVSPSPQWRKLEFTPRGSTRCARFWTSLFFCQFFMTVRFLGPREGGGSERRGRAGADDLADLAPEVAEAVGDA